MSVTPEQEKADIDAYLKAFHDRLPDFVCRYANIPVNQPWSMEWRKGIGMFFRRVRQQADVTRYGLVEAMGGGVHVNDIRFFEVGFVEPEDLNTETGFPRRYADALGMPVLLLFGEFCSGFNTPIRAPQITQKSWAGRLVDRIRFGKAA